MEQNIWIPTSRVCRGKIINQHMHAISNKHSLTSAYIPDEKNHQSSEKGQHTGTRTGLWERNTQTASSPSARAPQTTRRGCTHDDLRRSWLASRKERELAWKIQDGKTQGINIETAWLASGCHALNSKIQTSIATTVNNIPSQTVHLKSTKYDTTQKLIVR